MPSRPLSSAQASSPWPSVCCAAPTQARSMRLFGWSNAYVVLLFGSVAADVLIRNGL